MQVHEVMTSTVWAADAETTIAQAARLMAATGIAALPVLDGEQLVGLVTDHDLVRRGPATPVSAVMRRDVPACPASRGVADARRDMEALQLRQLPVADDQARLVGMISLGDVVAACGQPPGLATAA